MNSVLCFFIYLSQRTILDSGSRSSTSVGHHHCVVPSLEPLFMSWRENSEREQKTVTESLTYYQ